MPPAYASGAKVAVRTVGPRRLALPGLAGFPLLESLVRAFGTDFADRAIRTCLESRICRPRRLHGA